MKTIEDLVFGLLTMIVLILIVGGSLALLYNTLKAVFGK